MRRLLVAGAIVALVGSAGANGRAPGTSTIHFQQGHEANIVAGLTFGLVISHDGGATWQWMCEDAVGYGGLYDPSYAYSQSGAIFATTFGGLRVNRSGCTFDATPPGTTFVSQNVLGPDHALYFAAADPNDAKIYKSTDDGMTFPTSAAAAPNGTYWSSLVVAPSDPSRVYAAGYRFSPKCDAKSANAGTACTFDAGECAGWTTPLVPGHCENEKDVLLFESIDGGTTFTALTTAGLTTSMSSTIEVVGVSQANQDIIYARVSLENGSVGDGVYKINTATDTTWTKILAKLDSISFLVRSNGDLVAATPMLGASFSSNGGTTWTELASPPHINCLVENAAHEVWACTHNFDTNVIAIDGFGIMKTTDLATWTGVLRYQDIAGPVICAAGTPQADTCVGVPPTDAGKGVWCSLTCQLGITSTAITCPSCISSDAGPTIPPKQGCCDTSGGGGATTLVFGVALALVVMRSRTRRP
jgi:hypothetical protein